eukprot:2681692-Amphidinium_carterae.1
MFAACKYSLEETEVVAEEILAEAPAEGLCSRRVSCRSVLPSTAKQQSLLRKGDFAHGVGRSNVAKVQDPSCKQPFNGCCSPCSLPLRFRKTSSIPGYYQPHPALARSSPPESIPWDETQRKLLTLWLWTFFQKNHKNPWYGHTFNPAPVKQLTWEGNYFKLLLGPATVVLVGFL